MSQAINFNRDSTSPPYLCKLNREGGGVVRAELDSKKVEGLFASTEERLG